MVDLSQLQDRTARRCRDSFDGVGAWGPFEWTAASAAALGKALDLARRLKLGEPIDADQIMREYADCVVYLTLAASSIGGDLADTIREKFNATSMDIGSPIRL